MSNRNIRIRRVSGRQLELLWEFLNSHKEIATAYNRSLQAKEHSKRKWTEIAQTLNAQGDGAHKEWKEWSKYWVDYKAKLKKRVSALRSAQSATGGGPSVEQPLTEMELKFLQILGEDFGQGLLEVRVEPFPENTRSTFSVEDSQASSSLLPRELVDLPLPIQQSPQEIPIQVTPPQDPIQVTSPQHPAVDTLSRTSPPSSQPAAAASSPRRQRRRWRPHMTQEAARRELVESSRMRAEAAVTNSQAAVRSSQALENIQSILERMESTEEEKILRAKQGQIMRRYCPSSQHISFK